MLRLAKMYLYGQGCQRSVNLAQEWLRRARCAFEALACYWHRMAERQLKWYRFTSANGASARMHTFAGLHGIMLLPPELS